MSPKKKKGGKKKKKEKSFVPIITFDYQMPLVNFFAATISLG